MVDSVQTDVRALVEALTAVGIKVRREELRKGPGWRAQSGICRVGGVPVVFVDSAHTPAEQRQFLLSLVGALKGELRDSVVRALPESLQSLLVEASPQEALSA